MALKATIFKVDVQISDLDRSYYATHSLVIARHPSETDERMIVRTVAFILNAHDSLRFTKGLCADDEPDLWKKSLTNEIELWIELGMPDERRIRKACNRSKQVIVYSYGGRNDVWWQQIRTKLSRFNNLVVINFPKHSIDPLVAEVDRTIQLECLIQDGQIWFSQDSESLLVEPEIWLSSQA